MLTRASRTRRLALIYRTASRRLALSFRYASRWLAYPLIVMFVAAVTVVVTASPAQADYIYCPPDNGPCYIVVTGGSGGGPGGGSGGGGGGGGGGQVCLDPQLGEIPCYKAGLGWYNPTEGCYYDRLTLSIDDPLWGGHSPSDGSVYQKWCWDGASAGFVNSGIIFLASPPPGFGGLPSVLELALRAINELPIRGPIIGIAPEPGGAGLVGLPIWLWTAVTPQTWNTAGISATAGVPGLSVTATAKSRTITWSMGNGATVACGNPGKPYDPGYGDATSPLCGYDFYAYPSRGRGTDPGHGNQYQVQGSTQWHVVWVATTGENDELDVTRSTTTYLTIEEMQVVTR